MVARSDFWKGLATGTLVGVAIAIYAKWDQDRQQTADESASVEPEFDVSGFDVDEFLGAELGIQMETSPEPAFTGVAQVLNFREVTSRAAASKSGA